jgi:histidinol-phosphate aminotransferase
VLRNFSKTYGLAGLRIGYGVAPEECVKLLQRVRQPFNTTAMAQVAAIAALEDDEFVERTRAMTQEGIAFFESAFAKMKLEYVPSSANFTLVKVGPGRKIFDALQRTGVIVRPMDPYGLPDYIRITIGTRPENKRCLTALKKVLKELETTLS